jgi:hypothetical protein
MKTRYTGFCTALLVTLVAVPALFAQYPGQFGPGNGQAMSGMDPLTVSGHIKAGQIAASPLILAEPIGTSMLPMMSQPVYHQNPQGFGMPTPPGYGIPVPQGYGLPVPQGYGMVPQGYGVMPASYNTLFEDGAVDDGGSKGKCDGKCDGKCSQCLSGGYSSRLHFYGELLYLRFRDSEVAFAVPVDGPVTVPPTRIEVGPIAVVDMDAQPGFRLGMAFCVNDCTQLTADYTFFETDTIESASATPPFVLKSLVQHPNVSNVGSDFRLATARYDISFEFVDTALHRLLSYSPSHQFGYSLGLRYSRHEQKFQADFSVTGTENVTTNIQFHGVGIRGGLEYEQYLGCRTLVYAKGFGCLMPGEFTATYLQTQSFDARVVNTRWKAGRIMTMWDLELGAGISSKCKNYRFTAGYVFSAWTNMLQTDEWIQGVHANNFIGMVDTTTLDGLVARFEARY